jgi:hypothetical protein
MIKLKNILLKEEMSPREKREMRSSPRNIGFHVGYVDKDANRLIKLLNKQGLRKSAKEIYKSFKKHILEFQKDINNISFQHLQEAFPPSSLGSSTYSNKEAMKFSIDAVNKAGKIIGQTQKRVVDIFTSDLKNTQYD